MNSLLLKLLPIAFLGVTSAAISAPVTQTINDNYWGGNDHGWGGVTRLATQAFLMSIDSTSPATATLCR